MDMTAISALVVAAVSITALILAVRSKNREVNVRDIRIHGLEKDVQYLNEQLASVREEKAAAIEELKRGHENNIAALRQNYEQHLAEAKEAAEKSLQQQLEVVKAQITAENGKMLKERQEELDRNARKAFSDIAGDFNKNLKDMKEAFETNKKTQNDTSAELRTQIGEAVKNLREQTLNVGEKAEHLAHALRGQSKMQGCWGETQLNNILIAEGLTEGRDYEREETLRDELGIVLHNEDTGKRMRPDFILHYPDSTDVVVDCKVSLNALADFFSAENPQDREDAAERNLKAVRDHVDELSRKDYSSYIRPPRRCIDYTVMYVPNVNALVLARQKDPHIITDAFRKNVLITSEETLMPFLRMVRTAWVNYDQARNQEKIVSAARKMIDRVKLFCDDYARVGQKLKEAARAYEDGDVKLRESGQSILRAAHEVERLGVKGKRELAPVTGEEE